MDIAFSALEQRQHSPASAATVDKSSVISHDKNEAPTAGIGTADAGTLYPVTCGERYYNAANQILENESHIWTRENCNELGALIEQWISDARDNREPR
jgi:hypothetical protein